MYRSTIALPKSAVRQRVVEVPGALIVEMHFTESQIRHVCGNKALEHVLWLTAKGDNDPYFQSMDNLIFLLYKISSLQQCCCFDTLYKNFGPNCAIDITTKPLALQTLTTDLDIDLNNVRKDDTNVIYNIFLCVCSMFGTNILEQFLDFIRSEIVSKATSSSNELKLLLQSFIDYLNGSCNDIVTMLGKQLVTQKSLDYDEAYDTAMDVLNGILVKKILEDLESIGMTKIKLVIDDTSPQAVALHKTAALHESPVHQRVVAVPDALPESIHVSFDDFMDF